MSTSQHNVTEDIVNRTSITYEDQCGTFDVFDEFVEKFFAGEFDDHGTDCHVNSNTAHHVQLLNTVQDSSVINLESNESNKEILSQKLNGLSTIAKNSDEKQETNICLTKLNLLDIIQMDFTEAPDYLSKTNQSFKKMIRTTLSTTSNLEKLQILAVLMYKITCLEMIRSLWRVYRKSGMHELQTGLQTDELNKKIWPKAVILLINELKIEHTNIDHACLILVNDCLCKLDNQIEEYRQELQVNTSSLSDFTSTTEFIIEKYVQHGLICLRIEIDCQIALVEYHYMDKILKEQFLAYHPTKTQKQLVKRLYQLKYEQETITYELALLKQKVPIHLSTHPFNSRSIVQSSLINSIRNPNLQLQLYQQYKNVVEQEKINRLDDFIKSMEQQMYDYQKQVNVTIDEIWKMNKSLPFHEQLNPIMHDLIDQRLANISRCVACIYKFKNELFHVKSNN